MSQSMINPPSEAPLTDGVIGRRILALIADWVLIWVLFWVGATLIAVFGILTLGLGWLAFHVLPWLPMLYYILLIGAEGATPGQKLFGLAVRQDFDLARPTMAQALVWTLLLWVSFALAGLPFLLAFFARRYRAPHDYLSGLVIVRRV